MNHSIKPTSSLPLIGRLLMAAIFLVSAAGKIAAPEATIGYISSVGLPFPSIGFLLAIAIELGGGLLLAFGYRTRLTALALALFSIITGLVFHHAIGDQNQLFHLLKNLAIAGGLLQIVTFGANAWSLDALRSVKAAPRTTRIGKVQA
ncbi:MAG: putative rane protein [Herminiimonas sp.]|nr:putative rane protein [Herminiimonas sp.]